MEPEKVTFDLPTYLMGMEARAETRHEVLVKKVDNVSQRIDNHELRLTVIEGDRNLVRWFAGALIVALLGAAADFVFNHQGPTAHAEMVKGEKK